MIPVWSRGDRAEQGRAGQGRVGQGYRGGETKRGKRIRLQVKKISRSKIRSEVVK